MFNRNHISILFLSLLMCLGIGVVFGENGNGENWSTTRNITGNTYQQLKAYITSGSDFRYYFNGNSQAMKAKFQQVFQENLSSWAEDDLIGIEKLQNLFGVQSLQEMQTIVNNVNHSFYNKIIK